MNSILYNTTGIGLNLSEKAYEYFKVLGIEEPEKLPRHDKELIAAFNVLKEDMSNDTLAVLNTIAAFYHIDTSMQHEEVQVSTINWILIPTDVAEDRSVISDELNLDKNE